MFWLPFHKLLAGRVYIISARKKKSNQSIPAEQRSSARLRWFYQQITPIKQQGKYLLVSHLYSWHKWRCWHTRWLPVNKAQWALLDSGFSIVANQLAMIQKMVVFLQRRRTIRKTNLRLHSYTTRTKKTPERSINEYYWDATFRNESSVSFFPRLSPLSAWYIQGVI